MQSTTIDLILASFDVLANAVFGNEGNKAAHMLRSYLMNKLPILISNLSKHMYPPLTAEYCITEALSHVDTNAFPTLSSMFDESRNNNPYTDSVREEFCWACCLHGLLRESSIETILGETPYQSLPSRGKYVKDTLVAECLDDPERMQALVKELDNMDGNVGAVCHALTEVGLLCGLERCTDDADTYPQVLAQLCRNKETMSLKNLCSQLSRRPLSLDVILLFEKPTAILQPLCDLLDDWKYDEDQGEYQPVYEEFGSVLLLLLAFAYRYNLTASDIGARSPDSFVAKFLSQGHLSRSSEELSDLEKSHLGGWIHGLFDQEAGGLTDDLISSCPPQEFYLLIPTLFQNVVTAFATGHLSEESLKGGVECRPAPRSSRVAFANTLARPRGHVSTPFTGYCDYLPGKLAVGRTAQPKHHHQGSPPGVAAQRDFRRSKNHALVSSQHCGQAFGALAQGFSTAGPQGPKD